jgi:hypothetical protein
MNTLDLAPNKWHEIGKLSHSVAYALRHDLLIFARPHTNVKGLFKILGPADYSAEDQVYISQGGNQLKMVGVTQFMILERPV